MTSEAGYRDEYPLWSGDDAYILFARLDSAGRANLWVIATAGDEPAQLVVNELTPGACHRPLLAYLFDASIRSALLQRPLFSRYITDISLFKIKVNTVLILYPFSANA